MVIFGIVAFITIIEVFVRRRGFSCANPDTMRSCNLTTLAVWLKLRDVDELLDCGIADRSPTERIGDWFFVNLLLVLPGLPGDCLVGRLVRVLVALCGWQVASGAL